jgi:ferredoxin-nitrite reductase
MKFMVDASGADGMRAEVARRLGRQLADFSLDPPGELADHIGIQPQRETGLFCVGAPVHVGLISGDQMVALADLAEEVGGDVRVTRQQNFVLTGVPEARLDDVVATLGELGFPLDVNRVRASAIACTGEPHCNFSVTETKPRMDRLVRHLEERFGDDIAGMRLHLDGCPHACAQHWVGDLGFQGTTVRDDEGKRHQAYDVYLRGGLGPRAAIARPVFRRVPSEELEDTVDALISSWLATRTEGEDFGAFTDRISDEELGILVGREPARTREKEAA